MKERHPVDDLFARALRDAETDPPDRVWAGITRRRARGGGLRLRWWWPVVLLLLGGATYLASSGLHRQRAYSPATNANRTAGTTGPKAHTAGQLVKASAAPSAGAPEPMTPATAAPAGARPGEYATSGAGIADARPQEAREQLQSTSPGNTRTRTTARNLAAAAGKAVQGHAGNPVAYSAMPDVDGMAGAPTVASALGPATKERLAEGAGTALAATAALQAGPVLRMVPYRSLPANSPPAGGPKYANGPRLQGGGHAWWLALAAGSYQENRTWHGSDSRLVAALQGTELPHQRSFVGVLAGLEWRGGWNLAAGVEYGTGRSDFRHADRYLSMHDSLVTQVVTFNSTVVGSFTDTLTTSTEVRRSVATLNRYTAVRVPLEVGWHRAWHRWHFGLRAALGLDLCTLRSGSTLISASGGVRSVDIGSTASRTTVQLSGGPMLDVGYALSERLGLWASPFYATPLLSLSPTDGTPYAAPARAGIRLRLAYTLHPRP